MKEKGFFKKNFDNPIFATLPPPSFFFPFSGPSSSEIDLGTRMQDSTVNWQADFLLTLKIKMADEAHERQNFKFLKIVCNKCPTDF